MSNKIAVIYAGQGSQFNGMGKDFFEKFDEIKKIYDNPIFNFNIKEISFSDNNSIISQTKYSQPCIIAFQAGITDILKKNGFKFDYTLGLSLGEYSALYASNVLNFEDLIKTIIKRAEEMDLASKNIDSLMCAIIGLDIDSISKCILEAKSKGIVSICNINSNNQIVIGGDKEAVLYVKKLVKECFNKKVIDLNVSGPFHTKYMIPAGKELEKFLLNINFNEPNVEVLYNYLGGPNNSNYLIKDLLINQISNLIKRKESLEYLIFNDVKTFIEIGPGNALTGFLKNIIKSLNKDLDNFIFYNINHTNDLINFLSI